MKIRKIMSLGLIMTLTACAQAYEIESKTAEDNHIPPIPWHSHYSPGIPYYNTTGSNVNARSGPGTNYVYIGTVKPGQGGFINGCSKDFKWCHMYYSGNKGGWVKMEFFGGNAS